MYIHISVGVILMSGVLGVVCYLDVLGPQLLGLGFRLSGLGFRLSGLGFRVFVFKAEFLGWGFRA